MRDTRDPTKLYERIKNVQNYTGVSITQAADIVEDQRKEHREDIRSEREYSSNGR